MDANVTPVNRWIEERSQLLPAYGQRLRTIASAVRMEVVTRAIQHHVGEAGAVQVLDVGGGFGVQAVRLAQLGHRVVVLDSDEDALAAAQAEASIQSWPVRERMSFVRAAGEDRSLFPDACFDLVCAHSVLMYVENPAPLLSNMVRMLRPGGFLSILSVNPRSVAMRSGLQRRWAEAIESLRTGRPSPSRYAKTWEHDRPAIVRKLKSLGADTVRWWGVGLFSDHIEEKLVDEREWQALVELEWLAGAAEPYRSCAHLFHILARRGASRDAGETAHKAR